MRFYHHRGYRDQQRNKVYTAERAARAFMTAKLGDRYYLTLSGARDMLARVSHRYDVMAPGLEVGRGKQGGGSAGRFGVTLKRIKGTAARPRFEASTVLHELAHWLVFQNIPANTTPAHGPAFCGIHAQLYAEAYRGELGRLFRSEFCRQYNAHRVEFDAPLDWTPTEVAARDAKRVASLP